MQTMCVLSGNKEIILKDLVKQCWLMSNWSTLEFCNEPISPVSGLAPKELGSWNFQASSSLYIYGYKKGSQAKVEMNFIRAQLVDLWQPIIPQK